MAARTGWWFAIILFPLWAVLLGSASPDSVRADLVLYEQGRAVRAQGAMVFSESAEGVVVRYTIAPVPSMPAGELAVWLSRNAHCGELQALPAGQALGAIGVGTGRDLVGETLLQDVARVRDLKGHTVVLRASTPPWATLCGVME